MKQMNLRRDTNYELVEAWYASLIDTAGNTCENCGRIISNCAKIKNTEGRSFVVGMDCAKTLCSESFKMSITESDFAEARNARNRLMKVKKLGGTATAKTFTEPKGFYKEVGAGIWKVESGSATIYGTMSKQYPANTWQSFVLPMIRDLVQVG